MPPERRIARLERWLQRQLELRRAEVTLPSSGKHYAMHLPSDAAREQLFAEAKRQPGTPLPHWTTIWPSGMALADVVVARAGEVRGRPVLELGSGLGTTAIAALEAGACLTTLDYSRLALAFCRYNALLNTGHAPCNLQLNWREPDTAMLARISPDGGFPVILAADVLYESRDIAPLITLIERLLAPDGMLWLAEPGRKTARRFLTIMAMAGWTGWTTRSAGPWFDGSTDEVNVHILCRPALVDPLQTTLGGWRV